MIRKYTNIKYCGIYDFILDLSEDVSMATQDECNRVDNCEKVAKLLNPFLKELITRSHCYGIVLCEYDDYDYYKESIDCLNNDLYITIIDDEDDEDEYDKTLSKSINIRDLIKSFKDNLSIQEFVNLKELSKDSIKEINRFCYEAYINICKKTIEDIYRCQLRVSVFEVEKLLKEKVVGNYDKYPILSTLSIYYYLLESNDLLDFLYRELHKLILSQGFIYHTDNYNYVFSTNATHYPSIEKIANIIKMKNITINNFKKLVLNNIKEDVVDVNISNVYFNMITSSKLGGITFIDNLNGVAIDEFFIDINKLHPYKYKNINSRRYNTKNDIRKVENTEFNFNGENYMVFEAKIVPKCYAPSISYIIQVKYSFNEHGRFLFLKDGFENDLCEEELKNLPILVHGIDIYNKKIVRFEENI